MKLRSLMASVATAAGVILTSAAGVAPATADVNVLTESETAQIRDFFSDFGVDDTTQQNLIDEFNSGGSWDSIEQSSDAVATRTQTVDGKSWSISEYEDGSLVATSVGSEAPSANAGTVAPMGVDECGYTAGATGNFTNCHIYYWVGAVMSGFYANFTISADGYDSISSVWGQSFTALGSCSQNVPAVGTTKETESSTGDAVAGYSPTATMCVTSYTTSFPSYLHVGGNGASHIYQ